MDYTFCLLAKEAAAESGSFGERVGTALTNLVLGMLVVFTVLTILYLVILAFGKAFDSKSKKASAPTPVSVLATPAAPASNDAETVAAITAAITVMLEGEGQSAPAFRVVSFRKTNSKPSWNNK